MEKPKLEDKLDPTEILSTGEILREMAKVLLVPGCLIEHLYNIRRDDETRLKTLSPDDPLYKEARSCNGPIIQNVVICAGAIIEVSKITLYATIGYVILF